MKQIIAVGGGGFTEKGNLKLEKYILAQTLSESPKICFLPQASHEADEYILKFYDTFFKLGSKPSYVSLFGRVEATWKQHLLSQDIIYVGGGNTKSMIALWKAWDMDKVLLEAYQKGIVLSGISAGAICWFEQGITDSIWPLGVVEGLGLLEGSFCPHFDSEGERQATYREKLKIKEIMPGIALEDETLVHFVDGKLKCVMKSIEGKKAYKMNIDVQEAMDIQLI